MLVCRPPVSVYNAITNFLRSTQPTALDAAYNESGVRHGERPTFGEHLATVDGQAQLQALRELVETRLQEELRLLPLTRLPGVPHHAVAAASADAADFSTQGYAARARLHAHRVARFAERQAEIGVEEEEGKVELVLEAGLRADRPAAERLLADVNLRRRSLAGWRQHVEALRMYGHANADMWGRALHRELRSAIIPRMEFLAAHACAT